MASYSKVFTNPYPTGWENLPSLKTPIIAQALQQHTNAIISIENYLSITDIPQKTSELINDAISIPTKVSQLENDLNYVTHSGLPTKLSEFENDQGYITQDQVEIPENLSDYVNDIGFITNAVNTLVNYYLKSEVFTKDEVNQLLREKFSSAFSIEVVEDLPTSGISESAIYCIPKEADDTNMVKVDTGVNIDQYGVNNTGYSLDLGTEVTSEREVEDPFNG